jgi:hypothetical protein
LYAHNTLFNQQGKIIFGDFGASSPYQMLPITQQHQIKQIEQRALTHFIEDLLSICDEKDRNTFTFKSLKDSVT